MNMSSIIEKKSIYKLVKLLEGLDSYHLEELKPTINKIRTQLKFKTEKLGIQSMIGKCFKSRKDPNIIFKVIGIAESGMIIVDSLKIGGRRKTIQFWVGSFHSEDKEWQLVGKHGTYGIREIPEKEWLQNLIHV